MSWGYMGWYLQTEEELATKTPRKNFGGHGVLKISHTSRKFFLGKHLLHQYHGNQVN
jgi:hypothetical protein